MSGEVDQLNQMRTASPSFMRPRPLLSQISHHELFHAMSLRTRSRFVRCSVHGVNLYCFSIRSRLDLGTIGRRRGSRLLR